MWPVKQTQMFLVNKALQTVVNLAISMSITSNFEGKEINLLSIQNCVTYKLLLPQTKLVCGG